MRRRGNPVAGCVVTVFLVVTVALWLNSFNQPALSDRDRLATNEAALVPLEAQLAALDGVIQVNATRMGERIIDIEVRVEPGYNAQMFAERLYGATRAFAGEMDEFNAVLDDGVLPASYLWTARSGWTNTPLTASR